MGLDIQVKAPVPRKPVEFFVDPAYECNDPTRVAVSTSALREDPPVPALIRVSRLPDQATVTTGTRVVILADQGPTATVWAMDPSPHRIGHAVGAGALELVRGCRARVGHLTGVVIRGDSPGSNGELEVHVYAA